MNDPFVDTASAPPPEGGQRELLLKMYDGLRKEIEAFQKEIGLLATFAVLASGTAWGWIVVHPEVISKILLFVPAVLAFLLGRRAHALREGIRSASGQLARIEKAFGLDEWLGFHIRARDELSLSMLLQPRRRRDDPYSPKPEPEFRHRRLWLYIFWISLVVLNLVLAVMLFALR
jgi:hypothetical protein